MIRMFAMGLLLFCSVMMTACAASNSLIEENFFKSMKDYNKMLRWHEVEGAGLSYLAPEQRDEFMKSAAEMKRQEVAITDFRIVTATCLPEKGTGEAVTEFDYYILPSNRIKTVSYRQEWVYREYDGHKSWKVKNNPPLFR